MAVMAGTGNYNRKPTRNKFHVEQVGLKNGAIRKVWPLLFQALTGVRNENAKTYLIREIMR